jgi:mono/diheme cytochrome c family protein
MRMMRRWGWGLVAVAVLAGSAQARPATSAGERFARRACAGCHAIGVTGASRNPLSPPFRTLAGRLRGRALAAELKAISAHGHQAMPPIYMTPAERRAVAAYIRAVGARSQRRAT